MKGEELILNDLQEHEDRNDNIAKLLPMLLGKFNEADTTEHAGYTPN